MVDHGVLMAAHWNYRPHLGIQICSIDTVIARNLVPAADLIIVDEVHQAVSEGYKEFLKNYPNTFLVGVTATPYCEKGLRHIADSIVHPISMQELVDCKYLVPFRIFAPSTPDLTHVKISSSTKDYVVKQLEGAMASKALFGNVIDHWKKLAANRPTLCFAVSVNHSKMLAQAFKEAGIKAEHCDADTPDVERNDIIRRLEKGEIDIICNVGIFCTGVDIPKVSCIIFARPTTSRNLFVQQSGRGTRISEGKDDCLLLDHAGNTIKHGEPQFEPEVNLDGKASRRTIILSKVCKMCFRVFRGPSCPTCGTQQEDKPREIPGQISGSLVEMEKFDPLRAQLLELTRIRKNRGYKPAWVYHEMVRLFGYERARWYIPSWFRIKEQNGTGS